MAVGRPPPVTRVTVDATATRDVTAWQQLRGRAIRARRTWSNDCYRLIMALIGSQIQGMTEQAEMPADVDEVLAQVAWQPGEHALDDRLWALLETVAPAGLVARARANGLAALAADERKAVAVALMRRYNKVTHIYEMVKATGSATQVTYNRTAKQWERRESVAAKHRREVGVDPFTGAKTAGVVHAPLIYAHDPRTDVPAALERRLAEILRGCDDVIVRGWLHV